MISITSMPSARHIEAVRSPASRLLLAIRSYLAAADSWLAKGPPAHQPG